MADFSGSKKPPGVLFPARSTESAWSRVEPLISPEQLRTDHLFGIPLVSAIPDPITKRPAVFTDEILKRYIERAVSIAELDLGLDVFPVQYSEKAPFDKPAYDNFCFLMTEHRPVASIEMLAVTPSNEDDVFIVPLDWVEVANLHRGQINIIPLTIALNKGTTVPITSAGGSAFLAIFGHKPWIPAFFRVQYTTGFPDGVIPRVLNDLIGTVAAMEVLSTLATTNAKTQGASLSIDGMSQSITTPGPEIFKLRIEELEKKRISLTRKIKSLYGLSIFTGHV